MLWEIIGWVLWSVAALFTLVQLSIAITSQDGGVRMMARQTTFLLCLALACFLFFDFSKIHVIWVIPIVYFLSMMIMQMRFGARFKKEIAGTGLGDIGEGIPWTTVLRQVLHVTEFDPAETTVDSEGNVHAASSFEPYGYLHVESPILQRPTRLPIAHRDDFLLAALAFNDEEYVDLLDDGHELLVCYAPTKTMRTGHSKSNRHMIHFAIVPVGTLEQYYDRADGLNGPNLHPEEIFGEFLYQGTLKDMIALNT